jgi:hypothetical protein
MLSVSRSISTASSAPLEPLADGGRQDLQARTPLDLSAEAPESVETLRIATLTRRVRSLVTHLYRVSPSAPDRIRSGAVMATPSVSIEGRIGFSPSQSPLSDATPYPSVLRRCHSS